MSSTPARIIVGMTGATGQLFGIRALELLQSVDVESHLVLSNAARINIRNEEQYTVSEVEEIADHAYDYQDFSAPFLDGTWKHQGMLITPCSMKTLGSVAHGLAQNVITAAADVSLKQKCPLVLMPREKPFNRIHLNNMLRAHEAGATIMPPFLSFYVQGASLNDLIDRSMQRTLMLFDLPLTIDEWKGLGGVSGGKRDSEEEDQSS